MDEGNGRGPTASNTSCVPREEPLKGWQRVPAAACGSASFVGWMRLPSLCSVDRECRRVFSACLGVRCDGRGGGLLGVFESVFFVCLGIFFKSLSKLFWVSGRAGLPLQGLISAPSEFCTVGLMVGRHLLQEVIPIILKKFFLQN